MRFIKGAMRKKEVILNFSCGFPVKSVKYSHSLLLWLYFYAGGYRFGTGTIAEGNQRRRVNKSVLKFSR